jgi:hypothetical protein
MFDLMLPQEQRARQRCRPTPILGSDNLSQSDEPNLSAALRDRVPMHVQELSDCPGEWSGRCGLAGHVR